MLAGQPDGRARISPSHGDRRDSAGSAFAHTFDVGGLEPGTGYRYRIWFNEGLMEEGLFPEAMSFRTQPLWDYRFDPPEFTVALGSCSFINEPAFDRPGKGYGGGYEIYETIAASRPDLMLWLGDNVYFREVDLDSKQGMQYRYSHLRQLPELQALLGACPHYAIWDDHDYGPNDADGSWIHKDWAAETFEDFWPNPSHGLPDLGGAGITSQFRFHDVDFFLMDNRTFRINPDNVTRTLKMLGEAQMDWLISALQYSKAPFKVVAIGGQVVSDFAAYENFAMFEEERATLFSRIREEGIHGVVFLTGDRHSSELSARAPTGTNPVGLYLQRADEQHVRPQWRTQPQPPRRHHHRGTELWHVDPHRTAQGPRHDLSHPRCERSAALGTQLCSL